MKNKKGKHTKKIEFSKTLLIQESILIWVHTISMLVLAYICVFRGFFAELPWLTAMVALPWTAYAVSQREYYHKSQAENTEGGIKFETVMADYKETTDPFHFNDSAFG